MNKFKVGQRVRIIRSGLEGIIEHIDSKDFDDYGFCKRCYYIDFRKSEYPSDYKWVTVYDIEEVKEILDSVEKEYLGNVIKPFKNRVVSICKENPKSLEQKEFIQIKVNSILDGCNESICLPYFSKNKMYKGMITSKEYTLEELELN